MLHLFSWCSNKDSPVHTWGQHSHTQAAWAEKRHKGKVTTLFQDWTGAAVSAKFVQRHSDSHWINLWLLHTNKSLKSMTQFPQMELMKYQNTNLQISVKLFSNLFTWHLAPCFEYHATKPCIFHLFYLIEKIVVWTAAVDDDATVWFQCVGQGRIYLLSYTSILTNNGFLHRIHTQPTPIPLSTHTAAPFSIELDKCSHDQDPRPTRKEKKKMHQVWKR